MGGSSSKEVSEEKEVKLVEGIEQAIENAQESIAGNKTLPNLFDNYSKILCSQKPELNVFKDMVDSMKRSWNKVLKSLDDLKPYVGKKEIKEMTSIHSDYWLLLLKTRRVIELLITRCQIQKRYFQHLLNILTKAEQNNVNELTNSDKKIYQECIAKLAEWINITELDEIFKEWVKIRGRLIEKQITWKERLTAVGIGVGFGGIAAGIGYGCYSYWKNKENITKMIQKMIKNSKSIENATVKLKDINGRIKYEFEEGLKDSDSITLMKDAIISIDDHLSEYINQGKDAIEEVNEACNV